ncbi:NACHT, LRR and PYD domains-containing protein 3-like [Hyperolius riggenbachi]|uniref:NACHT, LRR and PYD domains-containing protein 3-like n=1 Tax=Hyperolius riggenbachi TaxID=752182 RepID=UPI0035A376E8
MERLIERLGGGAPRQSRAPRQSTKQAASGSRGDLLKHLTEKTSRFLQQLSAYSDASLRLIWEYVRDDLNYILENMDTENFLNELQSQNVLNTDKYQPIKMKLGYSFFTKMILEDLMELGREAVIGFWECLCWLQNDCPHPNFSATVEEITQTGNRTFLEVQILLDEHGHSLTPELTDIQGKHKQHLLEKTQTLEEHTPPGSTLKKQSFPINEHYVNMIVVSTSQFRRRLQNELIATGVKHEEYLRETQTQFECISLNRLFRWSHESKCVPHAVMVSGVPGIGKTTLMQKFVYDWVTGKLYQRFSFVFCFRFRDLNKLAEVSLEDVILQQYSYLESQLENILQHPQKLLFIFDGLDESAYQMDFRSSKLCTNQKWSEKVGVIVVSLVRQSLLKGCSVLITSRPARLNLIDTGVFQRITELMGFRFEDRQVYFDNFFDNKELSIQTFQYVQENDSLYTFCYIPSYCWIICTVLSMCFKAQPANHKQLMSTLPKTMTQLFVAFVANILKNHNHGEDGTQDSSRELLKSMGVMAEHGIMNHITVFDQRDLKTFSIRIIQYLFSCFLMESGQPPDVDYTFLHLTLQEFFAALVHFIDYNPEKLRESLQHAESYEDGRCEIFVRFLCGLSDISTRSLLKSHVAEMSVQASIHVITWLNEKIALQHGPDKQKISQTELLNLFYCLHESRNKILASKCTGLNKEIYFSGFHLTPLDCSVLSFILESSKETEKVNLETCTIQDEGLRKLLTALNNVKYLSLRGNELKPTCCIHLASGIRNNRTLRTLDLSHNDLDGPHFSDLMKALATSRLEELYLKNTKLKETSCVHLATGIMGNQTLRKLDLSNNNLKGPHFTNLMAALSSPRCKIREVQ